MSTQIELVASHAKAQLTAANDQKTEVLNKAVDSLTGDVAARDAQHAQTMEANAKAILELEDTMQSRYEEYEKSTSEIIANLTENGEEGIDSVKEVMDALIAADAALDASMIQWGVDAAARKAAMVAQIGDTVTLP